MCAKSALFMVMPEWHALKQALSLPAAEAGFQAIGLAVQASGQTCLVQPDALQRCLHAAWPFSLSKVQIDWDFHVLYLILGPCWNFIAKLWRCSDAAWMCFTSAKCTYLMQQDGQTIRCKLPWHQLSIFGARHLSSLFGTPMSAVPP